MQTPKSRIEIEKRHPKLSFQVTQTIPGVLNNDFNFTKIDFKTFYYLRNFHEVVFYIFILFL